MTIFAGEPGTGKSQLSLYIASVLSNGGKFHKETDSVAQGRVLLISGEDDAEDTIKPRLMALNANTDNIDFVKGIKKADKNGNLFYDAICVVEHIAELEAVIIKNKYKLLIIDPISLYLKPFKKDKEIRLALNVITSLAERHNMAVILNSHFSKPSGNANKNAIYRVMGSIGFAAAARIVYGIIKDPQNPARRLFFPIINISGQDKEGYRYEISPMLVGEIETCRIEWLDEVCSEWSNRALKDSQFEEIDLLKKKVLTMLDWSSSIRVKKTATQVLELIGYLKPNRAYASHMGKLLKEINGFAGSRSNGVTIHKVPQNIIFTKYET